MAINRKKFFDGIRNQPFNGKLTQKQVDGTNAILDEWARQKMTDIRYLAYMLATAKWETDHEMYPNFEKGGKAYLTRLYDVNGQNPARARRNGNAAPGDGPKYSGRGYVHLTWKNNYLKMTKRLRAAGFDVDLVKNPELAMRPDVAAFVMFDGMLNGVFTGKKLSDYFNKTKTDWVNARRIINGTDKAAIIAGIAKAFYADLVTASAEPVAGTPIA